MLVVDTNIAAYLLLAGPTREVATKLYTIDPDWRSEPLLLHELTNVLATAVRLQGVRLVDAQFALQRAHALFADHLHAVADSDALTLAAELAISGYDARFICLARSRGLRLVTEDTRLRRAAPELTQSLADALSQALPAPA